MTNYLLKSIQPQSAKIYSLLQNGKAMSARDIGRHLNIFPNAVYRAMKQLLELGFVQEIHQYPIKYQAMSAREALSLYSAIINQNFYEMLGLNGFKRFSSGLLPVTFLRTRNDLLQNTRKDTRNAKSVINYIVSGLEVPAETILSQKLAIDRGVKIRLIIQNLEEVRPETLRTWKKIGAEVKYFPNMEARIFIFDGRIVYLTSYNSKNKEEAIGTRFDYPPYAKLMDELFEQRWKLAKDITSLK